MKHGKKINDLVGEYLKLRADGKKTVVRLMVYGKSFTRDELIEMLIEDCTYFDPRWSTEALLERVAGSVSTKVHDYKVTLYKRDGESMESFYNRIYLKYFS